MSRFLCGRVGISVESMGALFLRGELDDRVEAD